LALDRTGIALLGTIIVIESAREYGITISFGEHARSGVPITLFSLLTIFVWLG
jgi:Na+/H+ antiporter NhaD/arsenite permease-like protein